MNSESVDLIATDPPFDTKRIHNAPLDLRTAQQQFDDRWRWDEVTDEWHDLIAADYPSIRKIIESAVLIEGGTVDERTGKINTGNTRNSVAAYIAWMAPRIIEMHRLLKPEGTIYLHCNHAANSYLRLLMDSIFGKNRFRNEIIWCYRGGGCRNGISHESTTPYSAIPSLPTNPIASPSMLMKYGLTIRWNYLNA